MTEQIINEELKKTKIPADIKIISLSLKYLESVWNANRFLNLTAARSFEELVKKHYIDSIQLVKHYSFYEGKLLDMGTGAGFPGVPLKIFNPDLPLYLMDSARRKLSFVRYAVNDLGLGNTYYLYGRAEEYGRNNDCREKFKYVCSRAVAGLPLLLEIGLPLVKTGGLLFVYKGPGGEEELKSSLAEMEVYGGKLEKKVFYELPTGEKRAIYFVRKTKSTPPQYPRVKIKHKKKNKNPQL